MRERSQPFALSSGSTNAVAVLMNQIAVETVIDRVVDLYRYQ